LLAGIEQALEVRAAPAATRPRAEAFGQLPDALGSLQADEILDLPSGDVKAEAKLFVGVHGWE
jgi:hypothetical protein